MHCGAAAGGHPALEDNGTSLMETTQGPACSPSPPPIRAGGKGRLGRLVGSEILAATLAMALWADSEGETQPRTWDSPQRPPGICESSH